MICPHCGSDSFFEYFEPQAVEFECVECSGLWSAPVDYDMEGASA